MTCTRPSATTATMYVDGKPVGGERVEVPNPAAPAEMVGGYHLGNAQVVAAAVWAADRAFGNWAGERAVDRAELLRLAADLLDDDRAELAVLLTREHGKTLQESNSEVAAAAAAMRYYAGLAAEYDTETLRNGQHGPFIERRVAIGVVAVIVPWNYPVLLAILMLSPVLIAGNTVVVKLPDHAPLALSAVLHMLGSLLPAGVLNVVAGVGDAVGAALTRHPRVRKVSFTGSTETGRAIMQDASANLKNLSLELGGNDPALVLESAVVDDDLIDELVGGAFAASGQVCYAPKRLYVHRRHFDDFVEGFTARASRLVVGNGLEPEVTMGPVNNQRQFQWVRGLIEYSRAEGGHVAEVGRRHHSAVGGEGYFVMPTVVSGLSERSPLVTCEQFGPVVPVLSFEHEEEAIRLANGTEYGLAASVWSRDVAHAFAVARRIQAGTVFVNVHRVGASDVSMPFGGFKQSGVGRGHGIQALHEASELQILAERSRS